MIINSCTFYTRKLILNISQIRVFDEAISCEDANLDRLIQVIASNSIRVVGRCHQPEHLAEKSLADIMQTKIQKIQKIRNRRSSFNDPSIYNFAG